MTSLPRGSLYALIALGLHDVYGIFANSSILAHSDIVV